MLRWLLLCLVSANIAAESSRALLPDPYGLGERLVMIDHLRQRRIQIPADASDEQIKTLFRQLSTPTVRSTASVPALIDGVVDEGARRQDHIIRLRRVLSERRTQPISSSTSQGSERCIWVGSPSASSCALRARRSSRTAPRIALTRCSARTLRPGARRSFENADLLSARTWFAFPTRFSS